MQSNLSFKISNFTSMQTPQLEMMKINSSLWRWVFSRKWVKLTQDELFSIFKSMLYVNVHVSLCLKRNEYYERESIIYAHYIYICTYMYVHNYLKKFINNELVIEFICNCMIVVMLLKIYCGRNWQGCFSGWFYKKNNSVLHRRAWFESRPSKLSPYSLLIKF